MDGVLQMSQEQYIQKILNKYKLQDFKPAVSTPRDVNVKLMKDDDYSKPVDPVAYQSMVGSLIYAPIATRPVATQERVWLRQLNKDLQIDCLSPTTIHEGNQGTIAMPKNPVLYKRTKHIDIKFHFVRQKIHDKTIELKYCPTHEMVAEPLSRRQFQSFEVIC